MEKEATKYFYIEIKAHKTKTIDSALARKLISKKTIIGVVTTGKITQPAKRLFDEADIAWVENFPQSEFIEIETDNTEPNSC